MGKAGLGSWLWRAGLAGLSVTTSACREGQRGHDTGTPSHLADELAAALVAGFWGHIFEQIVQRLLAGFVGHGAFIAGKSASVTSLHDVAMKSKKALR